MLIVIQLDRLDKINIARNWAAYLNQSRIHSTKYCEYLFTLSSNRGFLEYSSFNLASSPSMLQWRSSFIFYVSPFISDKRPQVVTYKYRITLATPCSDWPKCCIGKEVAKRSRSGHGSSNKQPFDGLARDGISDTKSGHNDIILRNAFWLQLDSISLMNGCFWTLN